MSVGAGVGGASAGGDRLAAEHARLVSEGRLQFRMEGVPPPPEPPSWLEGLGRLLSAVAPVLQFVFWGVVAVVVGAILLFIAREVARSRFPHLFKPKLKAEAPAWRPEEAEARALLADADALAAQGRYAEAAHLILLRSVGDIEDRDPRLLRPSLTSRDIAGLRALPDAARSAFGYIAGVVELGLFGGRPVDGGAWTACREAYARFALPDGWRAA